MTSRLIAWQLLLALLLTLLNCCKPLLGDDAAYFHFASHIAGSPLDPYGFQFEGVVDANKVLAPPVFLYWWALAIRLFGAQPILWKLWLFPFNWMLVQALTALYRHFARGRELQLLGLTVLAPAFLLNLNLMLDLPAVALGLAAVTLFLQAEVRRSLAIAFLAGIVAGLGMQLKYTAFLTPAIILLHAGLFRRLRLGLVTVGTAVLLFVAWEAFVAMTYGQSHFLLSLHGQPSAMAKLRGLALPLISLLGSALPGLALLNLTALGASRRTVLLCGMGVLAGFLAVAYVPADAANFLPGAIASRLKLPLHSVIFGLFGGVTLVSSTILVHKHKPRLLTPRWLHRHRTTAFLVLWLGLEVAGYFALSPSPGVRRILRLAVVGTLVAGHALRRTSPVEARLHGLVVGNAALGLLLFAVDVRDARAEKLAAKRVARWVARQSEGSSGAFHTHHWGGFEFYANRAGLQRFLVQSSERKETHDWLAVAHRPSAGPGIANLGSAWGMPVAQLTVTDSWPLRSNMCWRSAVEHHEGPRVVVTIYRGQGRFLLPQR